MIRTKVVKILDSTQVVLAAGANDGVKEGMEFIIYELSDTVIDPETQESLGQIEIVKGRVVAEHVQDKLTTAATKFRTVSRVVDPMAGLNPFTKQTVSERVRDHLNVEENVAVLDTELVVRIGDLVRSTT